MSGRLVLAVGATATLLAGTACGASGQSGGSGGPGSSAGLAHAKSAVAKAEAPPKSFPMPSAKLTGAGKLKGKTVYYVPITQQADQFAVMGTVLKRALSKVGISLQVCNGNSNPSQVSSCIDQATGAHAGAIITDSIPYGMAANSLNAAQRKKIPVLITDQVTDPKHPASTSLAYVEGGGTTMVRRAADWIIADSKGQAHVLINESTDSPSTKAYVAAGKKEFSRYCPGCKIAVNKISSANTNLISSSTSSALLKNPGIKYVVSEFDQYLQPTIGGLQQSGKSSGIKVVSTGATLNGLQMVKSGSMLSADAAQAMTYQGWVSTDVVLRMMLGQPVKHVTVPSRLFDKGNIGTANLTKQAQVSGSWFGSAAYTKRFQRLWGAA